MGLSDLARLELEAAHAGVPGSFLSQKTPEEGDNPVGVTACDCVVEQVLPDTHQRCHVERYPRGWWPQGARRPAKSSATEPTALRVGSIDTDYNEESFFVRHAYQ